MEDHDEDEDLQTARQKLLATTNKGEITRKRKAASAEDKDLSEDDEKMLLVRRELRWNHFLYFRRIMSTERPLITRVAGDIPPESFFYR